VNEKPTVEEMQQPQNRKAEQVRNGPVPQKPEASAPVPLPNIPAPIIQAGSPEALDRSVAMAERYFAVIDRIRKAAVKATNYRDWVDQEGDPYLEFRGAAKVANAFGVIITDRERERQDYEDDKGPYYVFIERANARWNNRVQPEMGTCSTRDKLFGLRKGENGEKVMLPLSEIDITNVMKKAHTNLLNRAIKGLLGLSFSWEELEEISNGTISKQKCVKVPYRKGAQGGQNRTQKGADLHNEAHNLLQEMSCGDKDVYAELLCKATAFKGREGRTVSGLTELAKVNEGRLKNSMPKLREMYGRWRQATEDRG
jgi:hypothetical protein